ncbi:long-chain-fatty-acid--CoA ligase [Candidatus Uabimicrobium amorphum]|uniref:Long-chain-fatty-acid--CoA ligase n=1 Tax=Uabimicrobium amorphum TaxID=2596890 RepID=A0A5S9IX37_UABAM|nr:long-chain fatty acid--CoA ligase [Candidatus Uabimicrobium amorphum]BBM88125.1 long-chain-fatty-acid--CoA ligase [Candidatus Uabimicrobium amorphum]
MLNIAHFIHNSNMRSPQKTAMRLGEKSFTYQELTALAGKVASFLEAQGIKKGDTVALSCPNVPYFPIVYYGILQLGAVVVPHNVLLKPAEIEYLLNDCEAKAYFAFEGTPELPMGQMAWEGTQKTLCKTFVIMTADPAAPSPIEGATTLGQILATSQPKQEITPTDANDTAVILYTSGTTGKPKGAELTHFNIFMNAQISRDLVADGAGHEDVFMMVLPLFHSFGQVVGMNATFYRGAELVMLPRFDPQVTLQLMYKHKVNIFAGVPTMYWALLNTASKIPEEQLTAVKNNIKVCASGGAALPVEIHQQFKQVFDVEILEGYGLSETSPVASFHHRGRPLKVGSIGEPVWGVEMKVFNEDCEEVPVGEVGEIVIRGHNIMKGYYRRVHETEHAMRSGWFHSGDMGKMDEDGYFYIVDRVKDMIVRGGFNVYPREIEEVLQQHEAVSLVAVIGVPHEQHGEEVKAFVVLNENAHITVDELIAWGKEKMAAYKYPRLIEICTELPMNATGKILKRELRDREAKKQEDNSQE